MPDKRCICFAYVIPMLIFGNQKCLFLKIISFLNKSVSNIMKNVIPIALG